MLKHSQFWARSERDIFKVREEQLKTIWEEIRSNMQSIDLFVILNKLVQLVGQ